METSCNEAFLELPGKEGLSECWAPLHTWLRNPVQYALRPLQKQVAMVRLGLGPNRPTVWIRRYETLNWGKGKTSKLALQDIFIFV